jgi:hypothetical protein
MEESDAAYLRKAGAYALMQGKLGAFAQILGAAGQGASQSTFGLPSGEDAQIKEADVGAKIGGGL